MYPNYPLPPGLSKEEPDLWQEDDIPTSGNDEPEAADEDRATASRDKPSRE